jgi:probable F420-dependent oxidoreductase
VLLGTSVLVLPLRHPVLLAKQLASLDALTGGRLLMGVGIGWMAEEFRLIGVPFEERALRAVDMVHLMRALWTDRTVDFHGRFWALSGGRMSPLPTRRSIPILWGGHSRAALNRVAAVGDGWHPSRLRPSEMEAGITLLRELCERRGRDPNALMIVARLGQQLTIDILRQYRDLGVDHVVIDPPLTGDGLVECREAMETVAATLRLHPRGATSEAQNGAPVTDSFVADDRC